MKRLDHITRSIAKKEPELLGTPFLASKKEPFPRSAKRYGVFFFAAGTRRAAHPNRSPQVARTWCRFVPRNFALGRQPSNTVHFLTAGSASGASFGSSSRGSRTSASLPNRKHRRIKPPAACCCSPYPQPSRAPPVCIGRVRVPISSGSPWAPPNAAKEA